MRTHAYTYLQPPTNFDVESFYRDLEKNPVFAITRRVFVGASGRAREVMFGTSQARFSAHVSGIPQYTVCGCTSTVRCPHCSLAICRHIYV
jgi:hypothetical protein